MNKWTVVSEYEGEIRAWHGLFDSKEDAVEAIVEVMMEGMGEGFMQTGELEQVDYHCEMGEQWLVSYNHETYTLTEHRDEES